MLEGKVALITGAARGLGRAFAEALLDKGVKVCVSDVDTAEGRQTETELQNKYNRDRVFFHRCDVTSQTEFETTLKETIKKFGGLDILCNNAGIGNEVNWRLMLGINLNAVIQGTLSGIKHMGKATGRPNGVIINVASAAGVLPMPFGPMYTASKHGVVGLSRSIGLLSPRHYGVRVNCLCPSFTQTNILNFDKDAVLDADAKNAKGAHKMVNMVGIMQPPEVAESFLKLVEDERLSGAVMLVTPDEKRVLDLPMTIPDMFAKHKL